MRNVYRPRFLKKTRVGKKRAIIFFIIVVLLILIFSVGKNILFSSLQPMQRASYKIGHFQDLSAELALKEEIARLKAENIKLKIAQEENKSLRAQLNFLKNSGDNFVLANLIGQRTEVGTNWFLLDRGTEDGVKKGLAVVDEQGVLVGTIIKVENSVSFLRPVFDRHSAMAADIITSGGTAGLTSGIVQGEYGTSMKMKYALLDRPVRVGDAVITSGLEEEIRRGLIIGQVAEIIEKPNAVFQEVVVRPLSSLQNLRIVTILLP